MIFEKLTPNNSVDISGYKEALDFALKGNMDITNVALTGTYGSGKSSILETYEKNSDLSYLHISLAHYDNTDGIDTKNLERKIINQLLHQVEKKRIPKTVFKVKENRSAFSIVNVSVLIVLWIVFIVSIINFKKTKNIISEILNVTLGREFLSSWIILGLVLSISLLYKFIKIQDSRNMLKSLSFFGNKIEILEETDDSYFDKFMNDVIYLFINSGADVIVFEDLDRFNDVTIYEKLQEINILLNRNLNIKNTDRKITFLYLLRDDTLISKDRTKFFDFIVPVVPVMDSSNSYEKLIDVLKDAKEEEGLDRNVLKKLTLYVDDFRLLKNIVNEYIIYNHRLSMNKSDNYLNSNKLLGIIVYKNLFPKDFALLQYGRSFINFVFSEKENILDNKRKEIRKNLDMLEDRIKASKQENLQSIDELDALYITFEDEKSIKVDGRSVDDFSSRIKFIEAIREKNYEVERFGYSNKYNLFNKLKENHDYIQRREILQDKSKQEKLNKEKIKLEKELRKVDELWSEVLHNKNLEFWEELVEKKEEFRYLQGSEYFNLLVVMLRDELIDEKYSDYIAYFYEGNLLYSDKKFIRSIFDKGNVGYDYRIEDPKKVIEYITDKDYRRYKILNIDLSAYLIKKGSERYRKVLVDIIEENKEYSFLLTLLRRIDKSEEIIELFNILSDNQPKITENIIQSSDIGTSDKIYYMTKYICFAAIGDIQNSVGDKVLRDFISTNPNFLSSKDIISKRFLEKLEVLGKKGVKFPDISNTERSIIEGILNKKVFEINKVNLRAILRFYNINDTKKEFKNRNYTYFNESLQGKGDDILSFLHENNNIGKYIKTYLSLSKLELEDEARDVLKILNEKQVGSDLKEEYIDRLSASVKIPKISDVKEKELREKLFIHGNVEESGENIIGAFKQNSEEKDREDELEIDIELISAVVGYINSFKGKVDIEKKLLSSSQTDKLFDAFVVNIELHDDKYIELLKSLNLVYNHGIDSSIPESRILLLIKNGIISFTSDNLQDMRDNHSDYLVQYIYYNFENYISSKENDLVVSDRELESLLRSGRFSLNQEKKIIDNLQNGISIEFDYSDTVKAYILEKAYDENDLKYIVEKFSELGQLSQKVAYRIISTRGLQELTDGEVKPEKALLIKLLYDSNIENDDRKWIFVNNLRRLSVEEADKQIHNLELPTGFSKALHRGRPRVEKNSLNKEIAKQFQKLEWVTTVTEKGNELYIIGRKMV